MNKHIYRILSTILVIALIAPLNGCSLFGSGKKKDADGIDALSESDLEKERFGSGNIPGAEGDGMFKDVHFDYDSSSVSDAGRQAIEYNVQVLQQNSGMRVKLEGHCDERGTTEYNLALGNERAKAVAEVLSSYGIPRNSVSTISYGEEIPLDPGHDEAAFAKNRRVHFAGSGK